MESDSHRRNRGLLFGARENAGPAGFAQSSGASQEQEHLEAQNQQRVDHLGNKVGNLKSVAINIGDEVDYQNKMLDKMSNQFDGAQDLLGQTMKRLDDMVKDGRANSMCYLVLGITLVMFLAYIFFRHR